MSGAARLEMKPVRGWRLKTVSNFVLLFALFCVAAFAAGRPPAAAAGPPGTADQIPLVFHQGRTIREASLVGAVEGGKLARRKSKNARDRGRPLVSCFAARRRKTSS